MKVLENGAIATKSWRNWVGKFLIFLLGVLPVFVLLLPAGIVWLISLGHMNFCGILWECFGELVEKVCPED